MPGQRHSKLREARARLAALVVERAVPDWLRGAAEGCLAEIDAVVARRGGSPVEIERLIAQAQTLAAASRRAGTGG